MESHQKLKIIDALTEVELQQQLLDPLFRKMGYGDVTVTHGSQEHGKDLVMTEQDKMGRITWIASVVKKGDISGSTQVDKNTVVNIISQATLASEVPYEDPRSKEDKNIAKVFVISNGKITATARSQIVKAFRKKPHIEIFQNVDLMQLIDQYWPQFYFSSDPFIFSYFSDKCRELEHLNELQSIGLMKGKKSIVDVFVPPSFTEKVPESNPSKRAVQGPLKQQIHTLDELFRGRDNILFLGGMGSGKSTLFRNLMIEILKKAQSSSTDAQIPVYVRFRDLIQANGVEIAIKASFQTYNSLQTQIDFDRYLKETKIILFLDGLDELPTDNDRGTALALIESFHKRHPTIRLFANSRPLSFVETQRTPIFRKWNIRELTMSDIEHFLKKWFDKLPRNQERLLKELRETTRLA